MRDSGETGATGTVEGSGGGGGGKTFTVAEMM